MAGWRKPPGHVRARARIGEGWVGEAVDPEVDEGVTAPVVWTTAGTEDARGQERTIGSKHGSAIEEHVAQVAVEDADRIEDGHACHAREDCGRRTDGVRDVCAFEVLDHDAIARVGNVEEVDRAARVLEEVVARGEVDLRSEVRVRCGRDAAEHEEAVSAERVASEVDDLVEGSDLTASSDRVTFDDCDHESIGR